MTETLHYFPVHWIDGMKINKGHFLSVQDSMSDMLRDGIGIHLSMQNYGLLPVEDSLKLSLSIDNHKLLRVRVEECQAVTPNGTRISIGKGVAEQLQLSIPYPEAAYELKDDETVESLITKMVKLSNEKIVPFYKKNNKSWNIGGQNKQVSIHQYMTLASILEKESTKSDENRLIASVFLNRLAQGMRLQTDPSANYAADKLTGAPTQAELSLNSPYNTYTNIGLPPGPISSIGSESFEALNNAENTDYVYFLHATKDGKAYFSKTYPEHEKLAKEHIEGYIPSGS